MKINIKVFYKLIPPFSVTMARHAHITQNNKFAVNSQYLQIKGRDEVLFLRAGKHQTFL